MAPRELAGMVAYAAAVIIAQFNTRNEFTDWDSALHTFTFANAVHQGLRRVSASAFNSHEIESQYPANIQLSELIRGIFDAAMRVYLNRFLNIPPAPIPNPNSNSNHPSTDNSNLFMNLIGSWFSSNLLLLLREDRSFHLIQMIEAARKQSCIINRTFISPTDRDKIKEYHFILAAVRYLAAHSPTMRSQTHTYQTAVQLSLGQNLFE